MLLRSEETLFVFQGGIKILLVFPGLPTKLTPLSCEIARAMWGMCLRPESGRRVLADRHTGLSPIHSHRADAVVLSR